MKRIFTAIKLHPGEKLMLVYNDLKSSLKHEKIKWVEPHNIHLTLKFFGETEEEKVKEITKTLSAAGSKKEPFTIGIKDVGLFGSSYQPRVIWMGIEMSPELEKLAKEVLDSLVKIGYEKDRQNFVPHLTIGRIKHIGNKTHLQDVISRYKSVELQQEKIDCFYLFESILKPSGPEYKVLQMVPLK